MGRSHSYRKVISPRGTKSPPRATESQYRDILSVEIACGDKLQHVLQELDTSIRSLAFVFENVASLRYHPPANRGQPSSSIGHRSNTPLPSGTPPQHPHPSFDLALQSLQHGVRQLQRFPGTDDTEKPAKSPKRKTASRTTKVSTHFDTDPFAVQPTPKGLCFDLQPSGYGLIQERIRDNLFALVVQAILWNQTKGKAGRPVLFTLLSRYPTPETLAKADPDDVREIIGKLGLQKIRSRRLVKMAQVWVDAPPSPVRRYGKRHYPRPGDNLDTRDGELLDTDDIRAGWEIAHLPGVGDYALDSYRIFFRDTLRGIDPGDGNEPEWKRVLPLDKDLRPYLVWRWAQEGWKWDPLTGHRERINGS